MEPKQYRIDGDKPSRNTFYKIVYSLIVRERDVVVFGVTDIDAFVENMKKLFAMNGYYSIKQYNNEPKFFYIYNGKSLTIEEVL